MKDSYSLKFLNKNIKVVIDRPLGSLHPQFKYHYPVNYGYVPESPAPDGEDIDAYILGVDVPIKEFEGICIAVIQRLYDNDDKLIVVKPGEKLSKLQIKKLTEFQEKFFKSKIISATDQESGGLKESI